MIPHDERSYQASPGSSTLVDTITYSEAGFQNSQEVHESNSNMQSHQEDYLQIPTTSQGFSDLTQSVIDQLQVKRTNDATIVAEFRKRIEEETELACAMLE